MWVFVLAATATSFSGWTFMGHPGLVYRDGFQYAYASFYTITIPFTGVMFLKRQWMLGKRFGYVTPGEMFSDYFQGDTIRILTVLVALLEIIREFSGSCWPSSKANSYHFYSGGLERDSLLSFLPTPSGGGKIHQTREPRTREPIPPIIYGASAPTFSRSHPAPVFDATPAIPIPTIETTA